jgi:hypothetical protein
VFPNVEVRHLHTAIALGKELNFTKAAHRLNLTQSALSRQITEIEKELRFRLFTRDNRRVVRVDSPKQAESSLQRLALRSYISSGLFVSLVPPLIERDKGYYSCPGSVFPYLHQRISQNFQLTEIPRNCYGHGTQELLSNECVRYYNGLASNHIHRGLPPKANMERPRGRD